MGNGIALIRGYPAAVDQESLAGVGLKGNQRLEARSGLHRAQAQEHLILRKVVAGQLRAFPLLAQGAIGGKDLGDRLGVGVVGLLNEVVALHNLVVFIQLPRCEHRERQIGKGDDEDEKEHPPRLEECLEHDDQSSSRKRLSSRGSS